MVRHLNLTDPQAQAWADGTLRLVLVPMKPQPYYAPGFTGGTVLRWLGLERTIDELTALCPYRPGEPIALRESWNAFYVEDAKISAELGYTWTQLGIYKGAQFAVVYKAGDGPKAEWSNGGRWLPSSRMPLPFARTPWPTLERVEARQCKTMQHTDYIAAGGSDCLTAVNDTHPMRREYFRDPNLWCWWLWLRPSLTDEEQRRNLETGLFELS